MQTNPNSSVSYNQQPSPDSGPSRLARHFGEFIRRSHLAKHPERTTLCPPDLLDTIETLAANAFDTTEAGSSCLLDPLASLPETLHAALNSDLISALQLDQPGSAFGSPNSIQHAPGYLTSPHPLIFTRNDDGERLYLLRYFLFELTIRDRIQKLITSQQATSPIEHLDELKKFYQAPAASQQAQAIETALHHPLSIISGGPGTGKTTTVVRLLHLLRLAGHFSSPTECLLLAPTGKAAERLRQSIIAGIERDNLDASQLPTATSTIHRALGYQFNQIEFRHDANNPLAAKVVLVDETSMVDLPLMARLLAAIPDHARVILIGDPNQLASVQIGTVLADLIDALNEPTPPNPSPCAHLTETFRNHGAIHQACEAIRHTKPAELLQIIQQESTLTAPSLTLCPPPAKLIEALTPFVTQHWLPVLLAKDMPDHQRLRAIESFRILTPTHHGPFGTRALNAAVEAILDHHGLPTQHPNYPGRSIICQQNNYENNLFNGDVGLISPLKAPSDSTPTAIFPGTTAETVRKFPLARLSTIDTAWALTIHRTQGSEYDHILLILPPNLDQPTLLTRELIYTGLSRARTTATIWSSPHTLNQTIHSNINRASGLPQLLQSQYTP